MGRGQESILHAQDSQEQQKIISFNSAEVEEALV